MFESARGVMVIADLDDAASLVLRAIAQGDFGPGPVAVMTVAERLKPAALTLEGEGRVTTRELLADRRSALTGAARSESARLALLGIEFSSGLSPEDEARALAAGVEALLTTYHPVIVLNRHMTLAPVLRRTIQVAEGVVIIAGPTTAVQAVQSFSAISKGFGQTPALWFRAESTEEQRVGAMRLSLAAGISLWNGSLPVEKVATRAEGEVAMREREPVFGVRVAEAEPRFEAIQSPSPLPVSAPEPAVTDDLDDLLTMVRGYLGHLHSLRLYRRQLVGARDALQRLLAHMSDAIARGAIPGSEEMGDLSRRHGALADMTVQHEQLLRRCQADWSLLHRALDPHGGGPER